jgi:putative transposase
MKWRNFYPDNHCYFITSTVNGRLPILTDRQVSKILFDNITVAKSLLGFKLFGYVIMPDHWHLLTYFALGKDCLAFNRDFKRFTALHIIKMLEDREDKALVNAFRSFSSSKSKYSVWKAQARVIPLYTMRKVQQKLDYIHNNPVKKGLSNSPDEYSLSSAAFYILGKSGAIDIDEWNLE